MSRGHGNDQYPMDYVCNKLKNGSCVKEANSGKIGDYLTHLVTEGLTRVYNN